MTKTASEICTTLHIFRHHQRQQQQLHHHHQHHHQHRQDIPAIISSVLSTPKPTPRLPSLGAGNCVGRFASEWGMGMLCNHRFYSLWQQVSAIKNSKSLFCTPADTFQGVPEPQRFLQKWMETCWHLEPNFIRHKLPRWFWPSIARILSSSPAGGSSR